MLEARIIIDMDSKTKAKIISSSISPEVKKKIPNSKINLYVLDNKIFLKIISKNISSLRAACNSYLRWINTANNISNSI
jgi:tRNA threonylcarbamoyladenosine modification (KEOPS) complex  Pcc1 subunit